jgi:hypothetical protein
MLRISLNYQLEKRDADFRLIRRSTSSEMNALIANPEWGAKVEAASRRFGFASANRLRTTRPRSQARRGTNLRGSAGASPYQGSVRYRFNLLNTGNIGRAKPIGRESRP